jgi:hypothetical protein
MTQSQKARVPAQSTGKGDPVVVREPMRPGLVTFAAVMMFVAAGFMTIAAITEWSNSVWLYQRNYSVASSQLVFWGFVDISIAILSAIGGYLAVTGHRLGQVLGCTFAGISLVRWLFYIPADPWLAVSIIAIDSLVIYALTANNEWFEPS